MKEQLAALYDLQSLDVKISDIQSQLAGFDGAKAYRRRYSVAKAASEAAQGAATSAETELKDNELKLKSLDEKRASNEKRLYAGGISHPKELSAVEKEIAMLKQQQAQLDTRVLELYEIVEKARAEAVAAKEVLDDAEKRARAAIKKEAALKAQLEAELAELTVAREQKVAGITDMALLSRYEAVRKRSGSTALAKVIEGKCENCHVSITGFIMRNLYTTDELQSCENCGRILMLEL